MRLLSSSRTSEGTRLLSLFPQRPEAAVLLGAHSYDPPDCFDTSPTFHFYLHDKDQHLLVIGSDKHRPVHSSLLSVISKLACEFPSTFTVFTTRVQSMVAQASHGRDTSERSTAQSGPQRPSLFPAFITCVNIPRRKARIHTINALYPVLSTSNGLLRPRSNRRLIPFTSPASL